jgi:hypothetical protein
MAQSIIVNSGSTQLIARILSVSGTGSPTSELQSVQVPARLTSAQNIVLNLDVTTTGAGTGTVQIQLALYDAAFEQNDLFGAPKEKGSA